MTKRFPLAILLLVLLSLATQLVYFLSPAQLGLPLDDGWIHATYARNLARYGQLCLNPGQPSTGTTSFLWTVLLAGGQVALGSPVLAPTVLNALAEAWLVVVCLLLVRDASQDRRAALLAGASIALLGNLVWLSLSGLETVLFLDLALTAIWCAARARPLAAGVLAGLLVLARPEGAALPLAMGLLELRRLRRPLPWGRWLKLFGPPAVAVGFYLAINLAIAGQPLTATFLGRRWLAGQPARLQLGPIALARQFADLAGLWGLYFYHWVFGYGLLVWLGVDGAGLIAGAAAGAMALAALVGLAWLWGAARGAGDCRSPVGLLLLWTLLHNLTYVVLLPVPSHGGRYQAINIVVAVLLIVMGAARLARARGRLRTVGLAALALWGLVCLSDTALWRVIYRDSVNHIDEVHVACGRWIDAHLPQDAVVATFDLGAVSYFAHRRIVDLGGLVDPEMARCLYAKDCVPYLRRQGVSYLAMMQRGPDETSLAEGMGLLPYEPGRPRLEEITRWGVPPERYVLHHRATSNAMPIMVLYRIIWP